MTIGSSVFASCAAHKLPKADENSSENHSSIKYDVLGFDKNGLDENGLDESNHDNRGGTTSPPVN